jgi:predicted ATP-dependent serine protease
LRDRTEVKGYISQVEETSFQVTDKKTGKVSTITYDAVDRVRGGGLSKGSKIAIGVGVGAAVLLTVFALVVASWHGN